MAASDDIEVDFVAANAAKSPAKTGARKVREKHGEQEQFKSSLNTSLRCENPPISARIDLGLQISDPSPSLTLSAKPLITCGNKLSTCQ